MSILYSALILGGMGLLFAVILWLAARFLAVPKDERIEAICDALPGANCGGCDFTGCASFAEALVSGNANANGCPVGGKSVSDKIFSILGVEATDFVKESAFVSCKGGKNANVKFNYAGIEDCFVVSNTLGGNLNCNYGCLGFGNCVRACPFDAIKIVDGVAIINPEKCTACKKCITTCPKNLIKLKNYDKIIDIPCSSHDKGVVSKANCAVSCIGCKLCQKECPENAIDMVDNLAIIDYDKCINCKKCILKCPRKIITIS